MAYSIAITEHARHDLDSAIGYITDHLHAPSAAEALASEFGVKIGSIGARPFAYSVDWAASEALGVEIRSARVKNYRVLYHSDAAAKTVTVLAFLHMRQETMQHLTEYYGGPEG